MNVIDLPSESDFPTKVLIPFEIPGIDQCRDERLREVLIEEQKMQIYSRCLKYKNTWSEVLKDKKSQSRLKSLQFARSFHEGIRTMEDLFLKLEEAQIRALRIREISPTSIEVWIHPRLIMDRFPPGTVKKQSATFYKQLWCNYSEDQFVNPQLLWRRAFEKAFPDKASRDAEIKSILEKHPWDGIRRRRPDGVTAQWTRKSRLTWPPNIADPVNRLYAMKIWFETHHEPVQAVAEIRRAEFKYSQNVIFEIIDRELMLLKPHFTKSRVERSLSLREIIDILEKSQSLAAAARCAIEMYADSVERDSAAAKESRLKLVG